MSSIKQRRNALKQRITVQIYAIISSMALYILALVIDNTPFSIAAVTGAVSGGILALSVVGLWINNSEGEVSKKNNLKQHY